VFPVHRREGGIKDEWKAFKGIFFVLSVKYALILQQNSKTKSKLISCFYEPISIVF
jgi:hypothetical protein